MIKYNADSEINKKVNKKARYFLRETFKDYELTISSTKGIEEIPLSKIKANEKLKELYLESIYAKKVVKCVNESVNALPEPYREIIKLRYFKGYTIDNASKELDIYTRVFSIYEDIALSKFAKLFIDYQKSSDLNKTISF